jgi:mannitol/fructose-specific phosphotransferase system IIA component
MSAEETPKQFPVKRPVRWNQRAAEAISLAKRQQEHITLITNQYIESEARRGLALEELHEEQLKTKAQQWEIEQLRRQVEALNDQLTMQALYYQTGDPRSPGEGHI